MKYDQYYTPAKACADAYAAWENHNESMRIADFCCGDGILLKLAPFGKKIVFGLDIDGETVADVSNKHPSWDIRVGDFLRPSDEIQSFLRNLYGSLDLVVLNPPFSCRGARRERVQVDDRLISCSPPLAFFYKCLEFLRTSGSMMAIMPRSVFRSDRDRQLLDYIHDRWDIEIEAEFPRTTFRGCHPHSVCVSARRAYNQAKIAPPSQLGYEFDVAHETMLVRGCVPMHKTADSGRYPVLHTRNLRYAQPTQSISRYVERLGRSVAGDVILIPRVGLPDIRKVRLLRLPTGFTLSDCVFAVACDTPNRTAALYETILDNWERIERLYPSTCAPYLTVEQLRRQLRELGWNVRVVESISGLTVDAVKSLADARHKGEQQVTSTLRALDYCCSAEVSPRLLNRVR